MKHFVQWCEAEWPGLLEWLETGTRHGASEFVVQTITGIPLLRSPWKDFIKGTSDYTECVALLRAVPSLVPHLGQLTRRDVRWHIGVERMRKVLSA